MKSVVYVTIRLEVEHEEEKEKHHLLDDFVFDLDYKFNSLNTEFKVVDEELVDVGVVELNQT